MAYRLRKNFSNMVGGDSRRFYGVGDGDSRGASGGAVAEHNFEKGCGQPIKWETMKPLTLDELRNYNLVPEGVEYAVTITETAGVSKKDMSMSVKTKQVAEELGINTSLKLLEQIDMALEMMSMVDECKGKKQAAKVDALFELLC